jgi:hypothetical protein
VIPFFIGFLTCLGTFFRSSYNLSLENFALRQQLGVLERKHTRPRLQASLWSIFRSFGITVWARLIREAGIRLMCLQTPWGWLPRMPKNYEGLSRNVQKRDHGRTPIQGKNVFLHRIDDDTEVLQITSARDKTLLQMRTFWQIARRFSSDEGSGTFNARMPRQMAPLCHAALW